MTGYFPPEKHGLDNHGFTSRYEFKYDPRLEGIEPARLNRVMDQCDTDLALLQDWFGFRPPGNDTVTVTAFAVKKPTGAVTRFTDFSDQVTIDINDEGDTDVVRYLLISEMAEVYVRSAPLFSGAGQWYGDSNEGSEGEALSRFLSAQFLLTRGLGQPPSGYTASNWWMQSTRDDYLNITDPNENRAGQPNIGCGVLFLNYLHSQLGYSIEQIIAAGAPTLAQCYRNLTGTTNDPFPAFKALIDYYFPGTAQIVQIDLDNPFPLAWPRELFDGPGLIHVAPGADGALRAFRRPAVRYWYGPDVISPSGLVSAGSAVALGAQGEGQLVAVYVGADGALHAVWSNNGVAQWQGPAPITPRGVADPGANVSLASRGGVDLNAAYVGLDSVVYVVSVIGAGSNWQPPVGVSGHGAAGPGGTVTLCARAQDLYALFVGLDGGLYVIGNTQGAARWQAPQRVVPPGQIDPGTGVSAVADGVHQIDVVYVGLDGGIHTVWKTAEGWAPSPPKPITPLQVADPSAIPSVAAHGLHDLDVVYTGLNSALYAIGRDVSDSTWHAPPMRITGPDIVEPTANVRLIAQGSSRLDAVFAGLDGGMHSVGATRVFGRAPSEWEATIALPPGGQFTGSAASGPRVALTSHGGNTVDAPGHVTTVGKIDLFGRGRDSSYYHRSFDGNAWSPAWVSVGGVFTGPPTAVFTAPHTVHLFGRGRDSAYYHCTLVAGSGQLITGWNSLGGVFTGPPTAVVSADRVYLLGRGRDSAYYYRSLFGTSWSGPWTSLGGIATSSPAAVAVGPSAVHVIGRGADSAYYHCELNAITGAVRTGWQSLGGLFTSAPAVTDYEGIDVVGRYSDSSYVRRRYDGAGWVPGKLWEQLGGVFTGPPSLASQPSTIAGTVGSLNIVGRGRDSGYYRRTYNGATWEPSAGWEQLGGVFTSPPLTISAGPNDLTVFGRGRDSSLYHRYFDGYVWTPNAGWDDAGGVFTDQ